MFFGSTHHHIMSAYSNGKPIIPDAFGHSESRPSFEANYFATRREAESAMRRWKYHFMPGREHIIDCRMPCDKEQYRKEA